MLTPLARFSAAHGDKFEEYEQRVRMEEPQVMMRWRHDYRPGGDREGWGLYFERIGPTLSFSASVQESLTNEGLGVESGSSESETDADTNMVGSFSHAPPAVSNQVSPSLSPSSTRSTMAKSQQTTYTWISIWYVCAMADYDAN